MPVAPVDHPPEPPHRAVWSSPCEIDPFDVPLERKLDLLFRIDEVLRRVIGVAIAEGFLTFVKKRQLYVSTEGSDIDQTIVRSGGGYSATGVLAKIFRPCSNVSISRSGTDQQIQLAKTSRSENVPTPSISSMSVLSRKITKPNVMT